MDRRDFLTVGGLGLAALGLPTIADAAEPVKQGKAVILVFLQGGASHQETFVIKPEANEKARSVTGNLKTKSGFLIGGSFEKLAPMSNLFSVVHSFSHINADHQGGTHYNMTGYNHTAANQGEQKNPSFGSIVNKVFQPNDENGIPHYVAMNRIFGDGASYFGNKYNPFSITEEGKRNLKLDIELTRFNQRMMVLSQLDKNFLHNRSEADVNGYKKQGYEMLVGKIREVFDSKAEPENVRNAYGTSNFAQNCMMARRLVENGVKFVTIGIGGWDMHNNIKDGYANRGPELDHGLSTLLADLSSKGMLKDTMVVVTGEFGRTLINKDAGRDHWARLTPLLLAGGGYGGSVIGEANKDGMEPLGNGFKPIDLLHTVLKHMDISGKDKFNDTSGRPRYLVEGESRIIA